MNPLLIKGIGPILTAALDELNAFSEAFDMDSIPHIAQRDITRMKNLGALKQLPVTICSGRKYEVTPDGRNHLLGHEQWLMQSRTLHLTIKRQWFDMIVSGEKQEEYRRICDHWDTCLRKIYDRVRFRNGYAKDSPAVTLELHPPRMGTGNPDWGATPNQRYFILPLGEIISTENIPT